jgi:hypothetical protein
MASRFCPGMTIEKAKVLLAFRASDSLELIVFTDAMEMAIRALLGLHSTVVVGVQNVLEFFRIHEFQGH